MICLRLAPANFARINFKAIYFFILQHVTFQIVLMSDEDEYFCMFNYGTLGFDHGSTNSTPAQVLNSKLLGKG